MPEDLRVYSSAPDDIRAALQRTVSRSGAHAGSRGVAAVGRRSTASRVEANSGTTYDRPVVLAAALGTFVLALAAIATLAGRRRRSR